jgi:hypothetical protein
MAATLACAAASSPCEEAAAAPGLPGIIAPGHARSIWVEGTTRAFLQFFNKTEKPLQLLWLNYTGEEKAYGVVPAGGCTAQSAQIGPC